MWLTLIRKRRRDGGPARNAGFMTSAIALAGLLFVLSCGDGAVEPSPLTPAPVATTVTVSPASVTLTSLEETTRLTAEVRDQNGQVMAGATVAWTSSDGSVAAVDTSGQVTAAANGNTTITATAGSVSGKAAVTVAQVVSAVEVSPAMDAPVAVGDTVRLMAEATDANGHGVVGSEFSWSSSDAGVASVDESGLVEAVAEGMAIITATAGHASGFAEINVANPDRAALVALHEATDGPNWIDNTNWLTDAPLREWYGVETDRSGHVTALTLSYNGLTGMIPAAIGNLSYLTRLELRQNQVSGSLPPTLGNLARLERLYVRNNRLTGPIPPALGKLTSLVRLELHSNKLSGPIPRSLLQLTNLRDIEFHRNDGLCAPGTQEFVAWIRGMNRADGPFCEVATLELLFEAAGGPGWTRSDGWLGDPVLSDWHGIRADSLGRVTVLNLSRNGLSGRLPNSLGKLDHLTELRIAGNPDLAGRLPLSLSGLSLRALHYLGTGLCIPPYTTFRDWLNAIPSHEGTDAECPPLTEREVLVTLYETTDGPNWYDSGNWLSDAPLGDWYGVETDASGRVARLYLDDNDLSGPIPPEIGELANLERLRLNENELTGPIPPQVGDLASLTQLRMGVNQLTGRLPPELGNLAALQQMSLGANRLEGPIPPEFGGMANLTRLEVGNNAGMTGQLPMSLTGLRLNVFTAGGTGLCAPNESDFLEWLARIHSRRISPCTEGDAPLAYLTQAVQSRTFPVPLVADEKALLRVFPVARQATSEGLPLVRARFYLDGREMHVVDIPAKSTPIPTEVDEANLATSGNVEIPGHVVQPGLEMVIEIDPDRALDPALGVATRIPETGRLAVEVAAMPPLELTLIPFLWTENPDSSIIDLIDDMAADSDNDEMLGDIHTLLPVGDLAVTAHEPVLTSENRAGDLIDATRVIRAMEGGTGHYMGMMPRPSLRGGTNGIAARPGQVSFSRANAGTMAHELGHNLSLGHATRCDGGFDSDPSYPYPRGVTGAWGFDFRYGTLVPPTAWDLMAPGGCRPRLISDYSFTNALRYRLHDERSPAAAVAVRSLLIWGGIGADTVPLLQPAFVVDAPAALPDSAGEYRVSGRSADGGELFSLSFAMPETADGDGSAGFAFVLPVQPGWERNLKSITLSGPGGSATLDGRSDFPLSILRDSRNGQVRGIIQAVALPAQAAMDAVGQAAGQPLEVLFSRGIPSSNAWRR